MKNHLALLLLIVVCVSCDKNDEEGCGSPNPPPSENFIEGMQVGDKLRYSLLLGENYSSGSENLYSYTGDTLVLEVLQITAAGALISESITPGSNMMADPDLYYWQKDLVYVNTWRILNDSLFVESAELFFASHLLPTPRLKFSDYSEQEVEIIGWRTSYNYSEANAQLFATDYTLFGHHYDSLSVYINNQPMTYDANGSTTVYSKDAGVVRSSEYGWWTQSGRGWDRIW